jgi:hypothetical protein
MTNEENNSNKGIGLITGDPKKAIRKQCYHHWYPVS